MYGKPFKMMGKSPMMKKLIGKQGTLAEKGAPELQAAIAASPEKPGPPMKDGSPMDMYGKSPAKKYKNAGQRKAAHASMAEKAAPTRKYSPMKQDKAKLKKATKKKPTDREMRISNNTEFNAYARKEGIIPTFNTSTDEGMAKFEKYYSNKANISFISKKQAEYFKNKK